MIQNKKIIGITGASGSGKGMVSKFLIQKGFYVIDADLIARQVVQKGQPCLAEVVAHFSNEVLLEDGTLNRKRLGEIVFSHPRALACLNDITHKYIKKAIQAEIAQAQASLVFIDAAALIEGDLLPICDKLWVVTADRDVRINRIIGRDGLTQKQATDRVQAQRQDYVHFADVVIQNDGCIAQLEAQVSDCLKEINIS
ncbi:MAG: dephospho-CoA kinase [Hyphomonadaceae bacterium]|nr:dephospho-CoA kinase [Clostridia bacterium]